MYAYRFLCNIGQYNWIQKLALWLSFQRLRICVAYFALIFLIKNTLPILLFMEEKVLQ